MTLKQKFRIGDTVRIKISPSKTWMRHFENNFTGVILYSYYQKYGGTKVDTKTYAIKHSKLGAICWYNDDDLILIKPATDADELKALRYSLNETEI